jgi:hypothetical protein
MLAPLLPGRLRISPASAVAASLVDGAIEAPPGVQSREQRRYELSGRDRRAQTVSFVWMWLLTHLALDTKKHLAHNYWPGFTPPLDSRRFPYLTHLLR